MADEIDATIERLHQAGATESEITSIIKEKYGRRPDTFMQSETMRHAAESSGAILPPHQQVDELGHPIDAKGHPVQPSWVDKYVTQNPLLQGAAHPTSVGDMASLLIPDAGGLSSAIKGGKDTLSAIGDLASRVQVHPSALLDFQVTQPLKFLRGAVSMKPPAYTPPVPPNTSSLDMAFRPSGYAPTKPFEYAPPARPDTSSLDMSVRPSGYAPDKPFEYTPPTRPALGLTNGPVSTGFTPKAMGTFSQGESGWLAKAPAGEALKEGTTVDLRSNAGQVTQHPILRVTPDGRGVIAPGPSKILDASGNPLGAAADEEAVRRLIMERLANGG